MSRWKNFRLWVGVGCMYAAARLVYYWQLGGVALRRLAWRIAGKGKAPPFTIYKHQYLCMRCYKPKWLASKDGMIADAVISAKCNSCRVERNFGWVKSEVEIIR